MKNDNNNSELEKLKKAALDQRSRMANEGADREATDAI